MKVLRYTAGRPTNSQGFQSLKSHFFVIYSVVLLLCACSSGGNYAPVVDRDGSYASAQRMYVVSRGETLYSIAWRHNLSFKGLANANAISSPYTIFPGQKLLLRESKKVTARHYSKPVQNTSAATKKIPKNTRGQRSSTAKKTRTSDVIVDQQRYPFRWQWPAKARLTAGYKSKGKVHKGIDLKGKLGESVYAANSGKIVYAGSGLVGYGKLLIIKHSDTYLSAYAHNNRLLAKEGQMVKVGQKVAEMGDTGTDAIKLHFEIRKNGKPIDPLTLLPRR